MPSSKRQKVASQASIEVLTNKKLCAKIIKYLRVVDEDVLDHFLDVALEQYLAEIARRVACGEAVEIEPFDPEALARVIFPSK